MITRILMDQLLKSGTKMLKDKQGRGAPGFGSASGSQLGNLLSGAGGSALATGAMSLLLGSKRGRKMGGKLLTYGGLGALGVVAYQAYSKWQQQQGATPSAEPRTVDRVPEAQQEEHSYAILRAVIGAAKADGHIDEQERQLIDEEIAKLAHDSELARWFNQELHRPLDPADIARSATTPEIAAEMYLASRMVIDTDSFMERSYLDELARQLKLDPGLRAELDAQADSVVAQA